MILEFQVSAEKLRQVLLAQVRGRQFCFPDIVPIVGGMYVIDRLEFSDKSTIGQVIGPVSISVPGLPGMSGPTMTGFNGRLVEYVQPLTVFAVELTPLAANGRNPSTNSFAEDKLRFQITMQVKAGVPQLRVQLASIDASVTSALIQSKASVDTTIDLDLSSVQGILGGAPVVATNAGMTIDAAGTRVAIRIELNETTDTSNDWKAFFRNDPTDLLGTNDWSLLVDKDLVIPLALAKVRGALASATGFQLVSGPSGSWMSSSPGVYVTLEGDALKACSCFFVDINVRVLVVITVEMSVPAGATDVLRLSTWMGFVPDGAAIACCALTPALIWSFLGGGVVLPLALYIGLNVIGFNQKPSLSPGASCSQVSDTQFTCDQPLKVSTGPEFSFTLRSIGANAGGLLLEGTMFTPTPAPIPLLAVDRLEDFDWRLEGSCHAGFGAANRARVFLKGARVICKVEIRDDPNAWYTAAVEKDPINTFAMPHITLTPDPVKLDVMNAPYPCQVLIWTDGGARFLTLAPPKKITAQQTTSLDQAALRSRDRCLADSAGFWEGSRRFNRKWLVDPPPDIYYEQLWQVLVTGLTPVEQVVAQDVSGNYVATALPSVVGMVHLAAHFVSEAAEESEEAEGAATVSNELALSLQQTVQHDVGEPRGEREASRQLVIKQVLMVGTCRFVLGSRIHHLSAARLRNVPVLVVVTPTGARVLDVSDAQRPRAVQTVAASGIRGAMVWNERLLVWGDHGLSMLSVRESRVGLPTPTLSAPVLDVTTVGGRLALLTAEGVRLYSPDLACAAHLPGNGACSLVAAGPRLLLGGPTGVEVFDVSQQGSPRPEGEHALSAGSLYPAPPTNDSRSVVFRRDASGGGRVLCLDDGRTVELARYARDPWFHRTARVGDIVARLDRDGSAITILRIANTYEA